jgi:hypothetical protein
MPDIQPTSQQSLSDDQELAKVLAGISQTDATDLSASATPMPSTTPAEPTAEEVTPAVEEPAADPMTATSDMNMMSSGSDSNDLEGIKKDAIVELRPLVDKLNLPPEEKFDTYLLLLRSTDDKTLIEPAHEAAKMIEDEARRAQALLDIIKEIDFLSGQTATAA